MKKLLITSILCSLLLTGCGSAEPQTTDSKNTTTTEVTTTESTSKEEVVTTIESEQSDESTQPEESTQSEEEIANIKKNNLEYLNKMDIYLLDVYHGSADDAKLMYDVPFGYADEFQDATEATIVTVGINFNTTTTKWLNNITLVDNNGEEYHCNGNDTQWVTEDDDEHKWGIIRFRVNGTYDINDMHLKLDYDDDFGTTVTKDLDQEGSYEFFEDNMYWHEDVNPYYEDAEEAEQYNPIKHSYLQKINGIWCFVDEYMGTSGGDAYIEEVTEEQLRYCDREFMIIPIEGKLGPVLTEDTISLESGNTKPYTFTYLYDYDSKDLGDYIQLYLCCYKSADFYENWDNMTDEEKCFKDSTDTLFDKYMRQEARESYLILPDGNNGTIKLDCTEK